jgi:hypothetical protein
LEIDFSDGCEDIDAAAFNSDLKDHSRFLKFVHGPAGIWSAKSRKRVEDSTGVVRCAGDPKVYIPVFRKYFIRTLRAPSPMAE